MDAHNHKCLNCDAALISAYCHDCGQKADTHRITIPHLIKHDMVHGIWHFDKGLLFTLREAFIRPGHMAISYIKGKRVKYYNVFYLILLVLGIDLLTSIYLKRHFNIATAKDHQGLVVSDKSVDISYYLKHYFKQLLFLLIPFFGLSGYLSFRRLRLNFAEHTYIGANILLAAAMWYFFVIVAMYTTHPVGSAILDVVVWLLVAVAWLQPVLVYYKAARPEYTGGAFALHMLQWYGYLAAQLYVVLLIIAACTGKTNIILG